MDTYSHAYGNTGHYRRPGTQTSYCGRELLPEPNTGIAARVCGSCAKAEQRDRVAAEQTVADRDLNGPSLAVRAGVRYCLVGTGRRVHYSNNDDTLCGREVTEYTDGLDKRHNLLCAPCIKAAEKRAYARALADASPLAAAAVDLAETVEQADAGQAAPPADESAPAPGTLVDPWTWIRHPSSSDAAQTAEDRAERRQQLADSRGANAYELAAAIVRKFVREMPQAGALRVRVTEGSPEATLAQDDLHALAYSGHTTADAVARVRAAVAAHIRHGEREVHIMFPARGLRPALYLPDVMALLNRWDDQAAARVSVHRYIAREFPAVADLLDIDRAPTHAETDKFDRTARAVDAVEHAEQVEAAVETVEDAEALYAARLVTEAEAVDNTWRGTWIGEHQATDTLFVVDGTVEQGALFAPGVDDCRVVREPIVARASFLPADLDRIKTKADADRAKYRAETDDRIAAECAAHGVAPSQGVRDRIAARAAAQQPPARRVIEGVVVSHNGTAQGSTPANATHPNVIAARAALESLAVATMTDHHDVTEPTEDEQHVRGYLIDPREGDRVAVYWLEAGRIIRRDDPWHGPSLDGLADRLTRRGWTVEPMLKSSQCVFAHRPPAN
ncbi:hypothetical protein J7F02_16455 [Streptomyces sp. ISL-112]|uniref:hypothetical protein n=1 Tax=unclassified Streptomyces TaxID=2593676 RepID=UPI001BEC343F|nr:MULTISPECIES: hypothetical protein [unclassified Streptomyces]MBT2427218.1 hypothetical protein [Streptomyces sp. ISL-112]MBT2465762.1 hypothetical protein [Streptomyces sp. ISL-63]